MSQLLDDGAGGEDSGLCKIASPDFSLYLSMTCGQVFGWEWDGDWCVGIVGGSAVALRQEGSQVECAGGPGADPTKIASYLGLYDDYGRIIREISVDIFIKKAVGAAWGLRVLKQDPWPCLGSYILSSNNRVERIQSLVRQISMNMGEAHTVRGRVVYAFPRPEVLAACDEKDIRSCGAGFRSPYLSQAARMIASREVDLDSLAGYSYERAKRSLMRLPGVGEKVADCVLLFAFSFTEAFPVDVWIKRAVEHIYFGSREVKMREIREFAQAHFGQYAGYAQEYIYYYARHCGLE